MKGHMKVWIVVAATWFCLGSINTVESASKICPKTKINDFKYNLELLTFNTMTFNVDETSSAKLYSSFLESFRKEVESDDSTYAIAILCEESRIIKGKEFLLVDLISQGTTITIAIQAVNLYFVAYKIGTTSYFFKDSAEKGLFKLLFTDTKYINLTFSSSYTNLPARANVDIGIAALRSAISTLPKYGQSGVDITSSIVTIIQTVCEAARFTLMERAINDNFFQRIRPTATMISYQNNWEKISRGIINSVNGVLPDPIQLDQPNGTPYYVTKVSQVQRNMGLLQFPTKSLTEETLIEELLSVV